MTPRKPPEQDKTRFTFWLPLATTEHLERVQHAMGKASVSEVVRDAIEVYISLLKARERGVRLYFRDEKAGEEGRIWLLPGPPPF
jgi:hypothetical protein